MLVFVIAVAIIVTLLLLDKKYHDMLNKIFKKKNTNIVIIVLCIILILFPFIISGIKAKYGTYSGICILDCDTIYGLEAFISSFIWLFFFFTLPTFVFSFLFIYQAILHLKKSKREIVNYKWIVIGLVIMYSFWIFILI